MSTLPNGQITLEAVEVKITRSITFTYKKALFEYVDGSPIAYANPLVYNGVISAATIYHIENDRKIDAIKQLRTDNDGLRLKDAKDIAEAMQSQDRIDHPRKEAEWKSLVRDQFYHSTSQVLPLGKAILFPNDTLLFPDMFIEYVKDMRNINGLTLKLAKEISEEVFRRLGLRD